MTIDKARVGTRVRVVLGGNGLTPHVGKVGTISDITQFKVGTVSDITQLMWCPEFPIGVVFEDGLVSRFSPDELELAEAASNEA